MYGRTISFTLLAPSLWAVLETIAKTTSTKDMTRYAFKTSDNSGVIIEIFADKEMAGSQLDILKAVQSLNEQAMAKVTVVEGYSV